MKPGDFVCRNLDIERGGFSVWEVSKTFSDGRVLLKGLEFETSYASSDLVSPEEALRKLEQYFEKEIARAQKNLEKIKRYAALMRLDREEFCEKQAR